MTPNAKAGWLFFAAFMGLAVLIGPISSVRVLPMFFLTYFLQWMNWRVRKSVQPIALVHALSLLVSISLYGLGDTGMYSFGESVSRNALACFFAQVFWLFIDLYVAKNIRGGLTKTVTDYSPTQRLLNRKAETN